ncbi:MAG: hypothetical protein ACI4K9_03950 [Candidatus Fimenecus sp.]
MTETPNTYEQFCKHKNHNVFLEEFFDKDGTHIIRCEHHASCDCGECICIARLQKSIQTAKNPKSFQK